MNSIDSNSKSIVRKTGHRANCRVITEKRVTLRLAETVLEDLLCAVNEHIHDITMVTLT